MTEIFLAVFLPSVDAYVFRKSPPAKRLGPQYSTKETCISPQVFLNASVVVTTFNLKMFEAYFASFHCTTRFDSLITMFSSQQ